MKDQITDTLHILQAKEIAKKVPDNMNTIRRIIQYSKVSKDTGNELHYYTSIPPYVFAAVCCVVVLYLSLLLSGVVVWYVVSNNDDERVRKTEKEHLLSPSTQKNKNNKLKEDRAKTDATRNEIIQEIRQKLEL